MFKKYLLIFFLLLHFSAYYSQNSDSALSSLEPVFSHQYTNYRSDFYRFIDTAFNSLNFYHKLNNAQRDIYHYSPLGNMGGPLNPLAIFADDDLWSYYNYKSYTLYFLNEDNIPFYYTNSPLTEANYWKGYNLGQLFNIYHTQNINEHWNFLIKYKRLNSLGFYNHNRNKQSSFLANTHYKNAEIGYEAHTWFLDEKMDIEEFGGIVDDSIFEENLEDNRILYEVNLGNDLRIMKKHEFFMDQKIVLNRFFNSLSKKDATDSSAFKPVQKQLLSIGHSFKYTRKINLYHGFASDTFYTNYFFDQDDYRDSSGYKSYTNTFYIEGNVSKSKRLNLRVGIRNLITEYGGLNYQFNTKNWGVTGDMKGYFLGRINITGKLDYILTGPLNESLLANIYGELKLYKELKLFGGYKYNIRYPDFFDEFYRSNNFIWQNSFEKITTNQPHFGVKWRESTKLKITSQSHINYLYYNEGPMPVQSDLAISVFKTELTQNFTFWNFLHFDNRILYQSVKRNKNILPLPQWVSRNAIYFEFSIFKKELKCSVGSEVKYFSSYYSPSYMPAIGEFYVANEKKIGNYPIVDAFVHFKIKEARIFLKYEHVNEGLNGYTYFAAPNYPFADRVLRISVSWRFFN